MVDFQPVKHPHRRPWSSAGVLLAVAISLLAAGWFGQPILLGAEAAHEPADGASSSPSDAAAPPAPETPEASEPDSQPVCKTCRPCKKVRAKARCGRRCRRARRCRTAAPAKTDPYAWKDLFDGKTLDGWKVPEFGGEGEVSVRDGAIMLAMGNSMSGITYTGEVPRNDFEIELEGKRLEGIDFFCTTTFPVGKEPCTLVVGGWGGTVVGLSNVDYYDASDNITTTFHSFKDDQWYKVRIRVTDAKVQAWIDDEQVVDLPRKGHEFGIRYEVELCCPLGISTWNTEAALRNIRIRRVKPEPPEADEQ